MQGLDFRCRSQRPRAPSKDDARDISRTLFDEHCQHRLTSSRHRSRRAHTHRTGKPNCSNYPCFSKLATRSCDAAFMNARDVRKLLRLHAPYCSRRQHDCARTRGDVASRHRARHARASVVECGDTHENNFVRSAFFILRTSSKCDVEGSNRANRRNRSDSIRASELAFRARACSSVARSRPADSLSRRSTSSPARRTSRAWWASPSPVRPCRDWRR